MDIEEDIKIVKEFNEKNRFRDCGIINNAIDHILAEREEDKKKIAELEKENHKILENGLDVIRDMIPKQKVKEELEKSEKENEPYEEYNKESRAYWINQGKISLAKKLLEEQ